MSDRFDDIVLTGAGLASCLGLSRQATWDAMAEGRPGIGPAPALECTPDPDPGSGQAPDLPDTDDDLPREARYLRHAIRQAMGEAAILDRLPVPAHRCGLMFATTLHGMRAAGRFLRDGQVDWLAQLPAGRTTQLATRDIPALAGVGLAATTCNACASGLASIIMGAMLLQSGQYDLILAGGYDTLSEYAFAGFGSLRLISPGPQRPFASGRTGLKLSEGYGVVVLERAADARARRARPLARIAGVGEASDAYHLSHPHPQGQGASTAIAAAMTQARIGPDEVNLIVAHATATPDNDAAEFKALAVAMGGELPRIPITAMKSHLGHTLGGAGAVELILACESMQRGRALPLANVAADDVEYPGLRVVTGAPLPMAPRAVVCLSAGFGGANSAVVLKPVQEDGSPRVTLIESNAAQVVITGVGLVAPGREGSPITAAELASRLARDDLAPADMLRGSVDEAALDSFIDPRKARRLSRYVKLTLAAMQQAVAHAGLSASADRPESAAILATTHASSSLSVGFYQPVVEQGLSAANPLLFAEGVPNAAAAHLSMALSFHGPCQTLLGTRVAGLDALHLARLAIRTGRCQRVYICAAEEHHPLVDRAYESCGLFNDDATGAPWSHATGFATMEAGVALVVESQASAMARGAAILAHVEDSASITWPTELVAQAAQNVADLLARLGLPRQILTSANATWLDRVELLGIRQAMRQADDASTSPATLSTLHGHLGEGFSATPLLGVASVLLAGRLPRLMADTFPSNPLLKPARTPGPIPRATVLASDYHGITTGVTLRLPGASS